MSKKFWNNEKLIGISALLVSLMTLGVFMYQTNLIRKQQYMSVYPHLSLGNQYSGTFRYSYGLENEGIGPAIIDSVTVKAPNGTMYSSLIEYLSEVAPDPDSIWFLYSDIAPGSLIPAGEEIKLVQLVNEALLEELGIKDTEEYPKNSLAASTALYELINDDSLQYRIYYHSIYEERWFIQNHLGRPTSLP